MGSVGRTTNSLTTDMVKIHVAVIFILSSLFISTQARYDPSATEDPMDRMVKISSIALQNEQRLKIFYNRLLQHNKFQCIKRFLIMSTKITLNRFKVIGPCSELF